MTLGGHSTDFKVHDSWINIDFLWHYQFFGSTRAGSLISWTIKGLRARKIRKLWISNHSRAALPQLEGTHVKFIGLEDFLVLWSTRPEPHYCKSLLVWPIHSLCGHFHRVIHLFYLFVDNSFSCCQQISQEVSFGSQPLPRLFGDGSLASCVTYKNGISFSIKFLLCII